MISALAPLGEIFQFSFLYGIIILPFEKTARNIFFSAPELVRYFILNSLDIL